MEICNNKMNILYFRQAEVWSPDIVDLNDEYKVKAEDEEFISVGKDQVNESRTHAISFFAICMHDPSLVLPITISHE